MSTKQGGGHPTKTGGPKKPHISKHKTKPKPKRKPPKK